MEDPFISPCLSNIRYPSRRAPSLEMWFLRNAQTLLLLPNFYVLESTLVIEHTHPEHVARRNCSCKPRSLESSSKDDTIDGELKAGFEDGQEGHPHHADPQVTGLQNPFDFGNETQGHFTRGQMIASPWRAHNRTRFHTTSWAQKNKVNISCIISHYFFSK